MKNSIKKQKTNKVKNKELRVKNKRKTVKKIRPKLVINTAKYFLSFYFIFLSITMFSQDISNLPITLPEKDVNMESLFSLMKQQQNIVFSYNNNLLTNKKVHFEKTKLTVAEIVKIISTEADVNCKIQGNKIILYPKKKKFTLSGNIKDNLTGESLPGTYVRIKNTNYGVETDRNGHYELKLESGDYNLIYSFIGYESAEKEMTLISETELSLSLNASTNAIDEVKVTKQRDFWGNMNKGRNISSIDMKKIELLNTNNASDLLQASASGVWSSQTSGAPGDHQKVRIRGLSSLFGCSDPLYIIDGVAVPIVNLHSMGIGDLNVNDIEKVTILKDAASTALYGYQGANGVVIIDTKRSSESHISFSTKIGVQSLPRRYDLMNTKDFLSSLDTAKKHNVSLIRQYYPKYSDSLQSTDWQNVVFRNGVLHEYQLSGSGMLGKTSFYLSGNYYTHEGIIANSSFKRYNIMANVGRNFTKRISATLNVRSSIQNNINNLDQYYGSDLIVTGINKSPCLKSTPDSLYYIVQNGVRSSSPALRAFIASSSFRHAYFGDSVPTQQLIKSIMNTLDASVNALNLAVKYVASENFYINASSSATFRNNYFKSIAFDPWPEYNKSNEHYILLNQQLNANYSKNINNHEFICTIGYRNYADNANWTLDSTNRAYLSRNDNYFLRNSLAINGDNGSITRFIQSFATHLNYNYKKKYYVSFIFNHENLKVNDLVNISNWFPSVALNWDISKEIFLNQLNWLNQFSLYTNWGLVGNYPVNAVAGNFYSNYKYAFADSVINGKSVSQFANHYLKSETSNEYNAGTNIKLFNDRVILIADYYTKVNSNLIIMRDIPDFYIGGKMMYNIGKILNRGLELSLELEPINSENFNWYSTFAISFNKQKIVNIGTEKQMSFYSNDMLVPEFIITENQALGNITGFKYLGAWTSKDDSLKQYKLGNYKNQIYSRGIKYLNTDTVKFNIKNDKVVLGKSIPDYTWHWSNTFRYKNFSIDFLWYGVAGVSKFNGTKASTFMAGTNREVTKFMQPNINTLSDSIFYQSSYFVEDASFIRLKQITFSYIISKKIIKYGDLKLSLSFDNFYTYTHYSGYDPEASIYTNNSFSDFAVDRGAYPVPRSVYFTVKLDL